MPKAPVIPVTRDEAVDINTYIFDMLQASRDPSVVPFASAFPDPRLSLQQLNRSRGAGKQNRHGDERD